MPLVDSGQACLRRLSLPAPHPLVLTAADPQHKEWAYSTSKGLSKPVDVLKELMWTQKRGGTSTSLQETRWVATVDSWLPSNCTALRTILARFVSLSFLSATGRVPVHVPESYQPYKRLDV
jgi:hypothetical protein